MEKGITSPEQFFGFQMGADRKLARWDKIVGYFRLLENESSRIVIEYLGLSTEGNPVILAVISSEATIRGLDRFREINAGLDDPRGLSEELIASFIAEGKATILQSGSIHADEYGGTQMMPELAYELITRSDEEAERIRENVIALLFVSLNPDGNVTICDWYEKYVGTEYEGVRRASLYHKYCGHDNNRDAFMQNLVETHHLARVMYRDWHPHAVQDHHQMGVYGPRFMCVPFAEPRQSYIDPLISREQAWYGAHITYKMEELGKAGALNHAGMPGNSPAGHATLSPLMNVTGCFTENASTLMATPVYVHPSQIHEFGPGIQRGIDKSGSVQVNHPHPWEGGWWHPRHVVEQMKTASWAMLDMAARNRETVLINRYLKAVRQAERGAQSRPHAYLVAPEQHDHPTAIKLIEKVLALGIEVKRATKPFSVDGLTYPEDTIAVFCGQPKMAAVKTLLGRYRYPDNAWTRDFDGTPLRLDDSTHTMAEFMGVRIESIDAPIDGEFEVITEAPRPGHRVPKPAKAGYFLDARANDSYRLVNQLLAQGITVLRTKEEVDHHGDGFQFGAFFIPADFAPVLQGLTNGTGLMFHSLDAAPSMSDPLRTARTGVYQGYWGGNEAEGWTRWVLEQFGFPYSTLMDERIRQGELIRDFDVVILPDDFPALISGDEKAMREWLEGMGKEWGITGPDYYPPEYRSGLGQGGTEALGAFVKAGGTLLASHRSCSYAIEKLGLPLKNSAQGLSGKDFFCPGSTLNMKVDALNPVALGMPATCLIRINGDLPGFDLEPDSAGQKVEVIVRYPDGPDPERELLQSGWLIGEKHLYGKAAMVAIRHGQGKVVLSGFDPFFRGWTHATFKLVFNCLYRSA